METDKIAQAFLNAGIGNSVTCDEAFSIAAPVWYCQKRDPGILRGSRDQDER